MTIHMLNGFKQFILRGNVVDLAVGVVIGSAFGAVVSALVADILTPMISAIAKIPDFSGLSFTLNGSTFMYGHFFNALISFVLVAAAIYFFVVTPVNALIQKTRKEQKPADPTTKKCTECLSEIPIAAKRCAHCTTQLQAGFGALAVVIIVAIVGVIGGGVYYASTNSVEVTTENTKAEVKADAQAEVSLKDLFGKNVMCTFDIVQGDTRSQGTAYIAGNDLRVDATSMQGDKLVVDSHMIKVGTDAYVWSSAGAGVGQGAKIKVDADMEAQTKDKLAVDWDKKMNYNCKDWEPDQSMFAVPGSVKFIDVGAMFNANASGEVNKCGACDMIPDAGAKAQCKVSLGC